MTRKFLASLAVVSFLVGLSLSASAATTLKIGTLAPQDSPWGREFKKWANTVATDTNGDVTLDFQWNGQAGDEVLMVQKIRSGQLDGAAITAVGLAQTGVADALLFQMPGLFANWGKLDSARNAVKDELNKQFEAKGFTIGGWGDVGAAKIMSVGFEVHHPADLQGKSCFFQIGDSVQPRIFSTIGGITPKQLGITEILPNLASGAVNVFLAPPLVAEQFQWASRVTHVSTYTSSFFIGALVFSTAKLQTIPEKFRQLVQSRGDEMQGRLTNSIRNNDAQAFARLKASKTAYDLSEGEKKEWSDLFAKVRQQLRGTTFSPAMFDKVTQLAQ